ncbi:MAG: T9SS type A sorting domain-containing protein [Saprospiraceae bacterium]|nr:T9SS type A sorting domain-containing protein [Saprospiraceae bacterium]
MSNVSITPRTTEEDWISTLSWEDYTIAIYNVSRTRSQKMTGMSLDQSISLETLHAGVYFVKINSRSESETVRIVKI